MKKPKKPDMITLAEMASLAGVTPQAISAFIRKQEQSGVSLTTIIGRRTKTVDRNNPVISAYIKNLTAQPGNRSGSGKPPTQAALEKTLAQIEKIELGADVLRSKYISRNLALAYLDKLLEIKKRELEAMINRILEQLAKEFGPIGRNKIREIRRILQQPCDDVLAMTRYEAEKFRRDTLPQSPSAKPDSPASGRKHGKKNLLPR
jgi:plasmid maintenance system antidote protein VapI